MKKELIANITEDLRAYFNEQAYALLSEADNPEAELTFMVEEELEYVIDFIEKHNIDYADYTIWSIEMWINREMDGEEFKPVKPVIFCGEEHKEENKEHTITPEEFEAYDYYVMGQEQYTDWDFISGGAVNFWYAETDTNMRDSENADEEFIKWCIEKKYITDEPTVENIDSGITEAAEPVIEKPVITEPAIEEPVITEPVIENAVIEEAEEPVIEEPAESTTNAVLPEAEEPVIEDNATLQTIEEEHSLSTPAEATVSVTPDVVDDTEIFELFLSKHNEFKTILDEINSNYSIIVYKANYILGHASEFRGKKYMRKSSTAFIEIFKEGLDKLLKYTKDTKESFIYTLKLGRLEKIDFFLKEFEDRAYQFRLGLDAITRAEAAYSGVTSFEFKAI